MSNADLNIRALDLEKYGITGASEIVYNPSYDVLYNEETKTDLEGFEKGVVTEMGAVNVDRCFYRTKPKR
jgi:phosphoenolpyruvate carboxykinase (ATP)